MISKRGLFETEPPAPLTGVSELRGRRWLPSLAGVLGLHLLLLAMILSFRPAPMGQAARSIDVSLLPGPGQVALAAPPSPTPAPIEPKQIQATSKPSVAEAAPKLGSPLIVKPKPAPNAPANMATVFEQIISGAPSLTAVPLSIVSQPSTASPQPVQSAGATRCELLESLKLNFQRSDGVKTALRLIPRKSLSVANAILLWNGRWIDESDVGGPAALKPIEQAVAQTVSQTPPICQAELLHGVRFITLGDASDTMVLAFGSGDWRWSDLLATLSPPT